jgi:hypothetical protein
MSHFGDQTFPHPSATLLAHLMPENKGETLNPSAARAIAGLINATKTFLAA